MVSLWTWEAANLARLEENMAKFQSIMPGKRLLLGLYMFDFGTGRPMPVDSMKKQCGLALKWLREGQIEGMIFLATNICDMNLEAVNWSRRWIAEVGEPTAWAAPAKAEARKKFPPCDRRRRTAGGPRRPPP